MEKWRMGDPAKVVETLEQQDIKRDKITSLKSVSGRIQRDMHQWGDWARRPQFWANLQATPFYKLVGIASSGKEPNIRLDPQSMAIHKSVMRLEEVYQIVLYAYYVVRVRHEDKPEIFNGKGISRPTYYRKLASGSVMAHNKAMRFLGQ